ncbi:MAG TPA: TolC family protein, partial [bacterium]|nr:TolC family protein [bacterium]
MRVKPNLFPAVFWLLFALGGIRADTGPVPGYAFAESVIQMNLEDVLTIVVDRNRDIQRSDIDVDTAALSVDNAEQQYHPSLSVIGGASSRWSDAGSENDGSLRGGDTTESVSARLNASYTVFDGFSRSSTLASNRELLNAAKLIRGRSLETALWQVADAFLDAAAAGARIRVQE